MTFSTENFCHLATKPAYTTPSAAFLARTNLFRHYKGGLYSIVGTILDTDTDETKVYYEHLWPHARRMCSRSIPIFFGDATPQEYQYAGPRFWLLRDDGGLIQSIFKDVIRPAHVRKLKELTANSAVSESYLAYDVPARMPEEWPI